MTPLIVGAEELLGACGPGASTTAVTAALACVEPIALLAVTVTVIRADIARAQEIGGRARAEIFAQAAPALLQSCH